MVTDKITYTALSLIGPVAVFLAGKRVGTIHQLTNRMWQYVPKGQRTGGDKFPTLALCKASLEAE